MKEQKTSEILKAVAHPVRLAILQGLRKEKVCHVSEMADQLGLPQSTLSQHLAVMRAQNLIAPRKEGVRTCYRIIDDRLPRLLDLFRK